MRSPDKTMLSYAEAIREATFQEMDRDSTVFVYGLDVADHKATFGSGTGLLKAFGSRRYFSTPLSEDGLMGFGLGAAISGLRPINVHIRADFLVLAMNQLINSVSCARYLTNGKLKVPLVIRAIIGQGWGQGAQHSKSLQSIYSHIPGLKIVMPSTPYDAKGLLISAIRDNNPVIILEHRLLYDQIGNVPEESYVVPIGKGRILRKGDGITIVATSLMNVVALDAIVALEKQGVSVELIDPRSISPLDEEMIVNSVKKTKHCIVVDNDWLNCGFSAEVAARISEKCFSELLSPVTRIGFAPTPCPTARLLENKFYPSPIDIIRSVEKKLNLRPIDVSCEEFHSYENQFKGPF